MSKKAMSSRQDKIEWLIKNQSLWFGYPKYADHVERRVIAQMREDGLLSKNTHNQNVLDLGKLIGDARSQMRAPVKREARIKTRKPHGGY